MFKSLLNKVSGSQKGPKKQAGTPRTTQKKIAGLLQKAFLSNELLEIRVDDQVHYRTAYVVDNPPTLETLSKDIEEPTEEQIESFQVVIDNYKSGEYLQGREFIAITKPNKKKDAAPISPDNVLVVRFFLAANRHTFKTKFIGKVTIDDQEFYKLSFPDDLVTEPGRQFHRAKPNKNYSGKINIVGSDGTTYTSAITDLSAGGISFAMPDDMPEFELNKDVEATLVFRDRPPVQLSVNVRSLTTVSQYCPEEKKILKTRLAGLQFHLKSRSIASVIEEEVVELQRDELQRYRKTLL